MEIEPRSWTVIATMPILRLAADMGFQPSELDRMSVDEIIDANEYLDVRLDAQEALRRADIQHHEIAAKVNAPPKPAATPRANRGAMMPRRPR